MWLITGVALFALFRLMDGLTQRQKAGGLRKKRISHPAYIEYGGRYWTGSRFVKDKDLAKVFKSDSAAWDYVDKEFAGTVADNVTLRFIEPKEKG